MVLRLSESKQTSSAHKGMSQNMPSFINYDLQLPIFEDTSSGSETFQTYPLLKSDSEDSKVLKSVAVN